MFRTSKKIFALILLAIVATGCGVVVESSDSTRVVVQDDYVSLSFYEVDSRGRLEFLVSECINLDDFHDRGSVSIETPYIGEDLYVYWELFGNEIIFDVEDEFSEIYHSSFDTYYFREGNAADFIVETRYSEYLVEMSGPYCPLN